MSPTNRDAEWLGTTPHARREREQDPTRPSREPYPGQTSSARESTVRPADAPVCRAGVRDVKRGRRARAAHWYFISIDYCPVCGRDRETRERRYTPRPIDHNERIEIKEVWDYCDAF